MTRASGSGSDRRGTGRPPSTGRLPEEGPPQPSVLELLTLPGRLSLLAAIAVGALGFVLSFEWFGNNWPGSFPLLVAIVPGALGAAAAYGLARGVLHLTGTPFYKDLG